MSNITVSNTAGLTAALKSAHDGDTISLKAGAYSGLDIGHVNFANGVTIASADPLHEAVLTNFHIGDSSGLHFSKLEFQVNGAQNGSWGFLVENSKNIAFDHLSVHGSLDGNAQNDGEGIGVLGSSHISITNSEFQQLFRGVAFGTGSDLTVSGNSFHDLRTTGLMVSQTAKATITNNTFTNFKPMADDHPDAIQFMTTGSTAGSHDITISGNVITRGAGDGVQGIFLRDEIGTMPYTNVTISNNLLIGTGYNGVAVLGGKNLAITDNTLVSYSGSTNVNWLLVQNADTVTASGNSAATIGFDKVTNLIEKGDTLNTAVTDNGKAALASWVQTHSGVSPVVSDPGLTASAPVSVNTVTPPVAAVIAPPVAVTSILNGVVSSTNSITLDGTNNSLVLKGAANIDGVGNGKGDSLTGNTGANHLTGGAGADTLDGGAGNDTLTGGAGADVFHFTPGSGADVILDFGVGGHDVLDISAYLKMGLHPVFHDVGANLGLVFGNGDTIVLMGVHSTNLHATSVGFTA